MACVDEVHQLVPDRECAGRFYPSSCQEQRARESDVSAVRGRGAVGEAGEQHGDAEINSGAVHSLPIAQPHDNAV